MRLTQTIAYMKCKHDKTKQISLFSYSFTKKHKETLKILSYEWRRVTVTIQLGHPLLIKSSRSHPLTPARQVTVRLTLVSGCLYAHVLEGKIILAIGRGRCVAFEQAKQATAWGPEPLGGPQDPVPEGCFYRNVSKMYKLQWPHSTPP